MSIGKINHFGVNKGKVIIFENPHLHNISQQRKAIEEVEQATQHAP
jgi:hypothetical protein